MLKFIAFIIFMLWCSWFIGYPIFCKIRRIPVLNESRLYPIVLLSLALIHNIVTLIIICLK